MFVKLTEMRCVLTIILFLFQTLSHFGKLCIPKENQCDVPGLCDGIVLDATHAETKTECIRFCKETPGCFWYSLDLDTKLCAALEDCPSVNDSKTNTTSGNKECSEFTCNLEGKKCHGTLVSLDSATSPDSCLKLCQLNPDCSWFTFLNLDMICLQLKDCPEVVDCLDCNSGQQECNGVGAEGMSRLMVGSKQFELLDLSNYSTKDCTLPEYPFPVEQPTVMVFDDDKGLVRACGGSVPAKDSDTNLCFTFDSFQWKDMPPTNWSHSYFNEYRPESISTDSGWWIYSCPMPESDGCRHNDGIRHIHSEVFLNNHTWVPGPEVPEYENSNSEHTFPSYPCTAQLNSSHTMVTGGQLNDMSIPDVMFYDWAQKSWTKGPQMINPRKRHMCLSLDQGRVMVAGGIGLFSERLVSVEVFDSNLQAWYQSTDLPEEHFGSSDYIHGSYFVASGTKPVWINPGHNQEGNSQYNIWMFEDGVWILLDMTPSMSEYDVKFALLLPDDFVPDCN